MKCRSRVRQGVCAAARSGGMRASRPTFARLAAAIPVGRAFAVGRRGGIYPARGRWRRRRVARDDASIVPYRGCDHAKLRPSRLGAALPQICLPCQREVARPQAVTEGLPRLEMPLPGAAGCLRCRKVRRDEGIPPYVCPGGRGRPGWPGVRPGLQGRAMALPRVLAPPRGGFRHFATMGAAVLGGLTVYSAGRHLR